ncbi:MAG: hypothetical protein AAGG07_13045 [Planctomycetota bacterium]
MLLFHAAWSGPENLAYTAFNSCLDGDGAPKPIRREDARSLPVGLRSELSTNPFDASASLVDALLAVTESAQDRATHVVGDSPGLSRSRPVSKPGGWTRKELVDEALEFGAKCSNSTFDSIRKAAEIPAAEKGGRGAQRRFSNADLRKLIAAVESGRFRSGETIAAAWRQLLDES